MELVLNSQNIVNIL